MDGRSLARRVWERRGLLGWLLWVLVLPLSLFYSSVIRIRSFLYSTGWKPSRGLPCAVVSVGNLTVGGTGKTPTTLWLAEELAHQGYRVAILSRGYKGTGSGPRILGPGFAQGGDSLSAGDEPVIMAQIYGQRVGVGKKRYDAANLVLRHTPIDVFLLDDGFQHRQLERDLDLLLLGQEWSGWVIPAGPFREPRSAMSRAHLYLITGSREKWEAILARRGGSSETFCGCLEPTSLLTKEENGWGELPLAEISRARVLAVSAIAKPEPFYCMIQEWGGDIVDTMEFPDHHRYSIKDWQEISRASRHAERIITTEKDIVKLIQFPFANGSILALRVKMVVERGDALIGAVERAIHAKRERVGPE